MSRSINEVIKEILIMRLAVLASGRGSNLQSIIEAIERDQLPLEIVLVASDKKDAYALTRAAKYHIPTAVLSPKGFASREDYGKALADLVEEAGAELVALAGFMLIVPPSFLGRFPNRVLNIHPALLPSFPGLHAQAQAWRYGVKISGCTVHFVDSGMDTGPIIAQTPVPVLDDDTPETLEDRILVQEHILYPRVLGWMAKGLVSVEDGRVKVRQK